MCNLRHGDNVSAIDYEAVKAEIEEGCNPPVALTCAIAKEAVLEELVAVAGDLQPELCTALAEATLARKTAERRTMSPLELTEKLADEYAAQPPYAEVERVAFEYDATSILDRLNSETRRDEKMMSLVRAVLLFGKSSGAVWQMRAHVAEHSLRSIAGALETREEALLPDNDVIRGMKAVRDWTFDNELKRPPPGYEARNNFLKGWRARKQYEKECDFLMRHVPWWRDFSTSSHTHEEVVDAVNTALLEGLSLIHI